MGSHDQTVSEITFGVFVAFSSTRFEAIARATVGRLRSPQLIFNEEKRGIYTKGQRRMVTGLIITPTATISIGRTRKRSISAMLHKVKTGESDPVKTGKLKGLLGFCLATEPDFVTRMRQKYGYDVVDHVLRFAVPPRSTSRLPR
jgi:RNA-directed DNA polymerase